MREIITLLCLFALGCEQPAPATPVDASWVPQCEQAVTPATNREAAPASAGVLAPARPLVPGAMPQSDLGPPAVSLPNPPRFDPHLAPPAEPREFSEPLAYRDPLPHDTCNLDAGKLNPELPLRWTGAVVYFMSSGCRPCHTLIDDLRTKATEWKCGDGNNVHFKLRDVLQQPAPESLGIGLVPCVIYYEDGQEKSRIVGYRGTDEELNVILRRHPKCRKPKRNATQPAAIPAIYDAPPQTFAPPVLVYESPIYYAPMQTSYGVGPAQSSVGLSLFGFPIIGAGCSSCMNGGCR